jgi:hypothetical protein
MRLIICSKKTKCQPNLTPKRLVSGLGLIEECVEAYTVYSGLNPQVTSFTNHYVMNFLTVPKNHTIEVHHVSCVMIHVSLAQNETRYDIDL